MVTGEDHGVLSSGQDSDLSHMHLGIIMQGILFASEPQNRPATSFRRLRSTLATSSSSPSIRRCSATNSSETVLVYHIPHQPVCSLCAESARDAQIRCTG